MPDSESWGNEILAAAQEQAKLAVLLARQAENIQRLTIIVEQLITRVQQLETYHEGER